MCGEFLGEVMGTLHQGVSDIPITRAGKFRLQALGERLQPIADNNDNRGKSAAFPSTGTSFATENM